MFMDKEHAVRLVICVLEGEANCLCGDAGTDVFIFRIFNIVDGQKLSSDEDHAAVVSPSAAARQESDPFEGDRMWPSKIALNLPEQ